jgi:glycosyltransferase involved in cell wall biosynthesis
MSLGIKISIITVSYNAVKTIEETILSVLKQSYSNIEYIIIDGGSTDGTVDVIEKYQDKISVWISEPDRGIYDAMNKGINLAKGEWIGIINSDDFYTKNALERVHNEVKNNPDIDVIFGNLNIVDVNSNIIFELKPNIILNNIEHTFSIFHPSMFIKRSIYYNIGLYNLKYKLSSDWDLTKKIFLHGSKFSYLNFTLSNFRKGGAGSGFKKIHLIERISIRHNPFKLSFIIYDIKDILIFLYFKIYPNKSVF